MSNKQITDDILKKINQIKQDKVDKNNSKGSNNSSSATVDPFMGFNISKEGLSQFKKSKEPNVNPLNDFKNTFNVNPTEVISNPLPSNLGKNTVEDKSNESKEKNDIMKSNKNIIVTNNDSFNYNINNNFNNIDNNNENKPKYLNNRINDTNSGDNKNFGANNFNNLKNNSNNTMNKIDISDINLNNINFFSKENKENMNSKDKGHSQINDHLKQSIQQNSIINNINNTNNNDFITSYKNKSNSNINNLNLDKEREISKYEIMRKMEAKLKNPFGLCTDINSNNADNQTKTLSSIRAQNISKETINPSNQVKFEFEETKSPNLTKRIAKLNQQLKQTRENEIKTAKSKFQNLKETMNNPQLFSVSQANEPNSNTLFTFSNDPPSLFNNNFNETFTKQSETTKHQVYKKRIDEELSSFSKDLDWHPRSKVSDDNNSNLKTNFEKMFIAKMPNTTENPFTKNLNLNHTKNLENNNNNIIVNNSTNTNINSKLNITIEELRLFNNKLRFLSDTNIKTLDSSLLSELKSLSQVAKSIVEKSSYYN